MMSTLKVTGIAAAVLAAAGAAAVVAGSELVDRSQAELLELLESTRARFPGLELKNEVTGSTLLSRSGRLSINYPLTFKNSRGKARDLSIQFAVDYQYSFSPGGATGTFIKVADYGNLVPLNFEGDFETSLSDLQNVRVRFDPLNVPQSKSGDLLRVDKSILDVNIEDSGTAELAWSTENVNCHGVEAADQKSNDVAIKNLCLSVIAAGGQSLASSEMHLSFNSMTVDTRPLPASGPGSPAQPGEPDTPAPENSASGGAAPAGENASAAGMQTAPAPAIPESSYTITGVDHIMGIRDVDSAGLGVLYGRGTIGSIKANPGTAAREHVQPEFSNSYYDFSMKEIDTRILASLTDLQTLSSMGPEKLRLLFSKNIRANIKTLHTEIGSEKFDAAGLLTINPEQPASSARAEFILSASEKFVKSVAAWQQVPEEWLQTQLELFGTSGYLTRRDGNCETWVSYRGGRLFMNEQPVR